MIGEKGTASMKPNNPYFDWRDITQLDPSKVIPFPVKCDVETRIRIYGTQLMDEVVENITASNYLYQIQIYHHLGENLLRKFPERHEDIMDAAMTFWERVQTKLKEEKE